MLYVVAAILFFLEAVGVKSLPNAMMWGFFFLALGLALGGPSWTFWKKTA